MLAFAARAKGALVDDLCTYIYIYTHDPPLEMGDLFHMM